MVVETMKKEHLSIYAAMQEFGINDHKIIERWERIYLEEGPEGLTVERRGRGSTGRPKKLPKEVEEDLLAEVQRLRAENDYLKNLQPYPLQGQNLRFPCLGRKAYYDRLKEETLHYEALANYSYWG